MLQNDDGLAKISFAWCGRTQYLRLLSLSLPLSFLPFLPFRIPKKSIRSECILLFAIVHRTPFIQIAKNRICFSFSLLRIDRNKCGTSTRLVLVSRISNVYTVDAHRVSFRCANNGDRGRAQKKTNNIDDLTTSRRRRRWTTTNNNNKNKQIYNIVFFFFLSPVNLCHIPDKIYSLFALAQAHVSVFYCSCLLCFRVAHTFNSHAI